MPALQILNVAMVDCNTYKHVRNWLSELHTGWQLLGA